MKRSHVLPNVFALTLSGLGLAACAAPPAQDAPPPAPVAAVTESKCDASSLDWTHGQVADDALVERARVEAGASVVRMLRPGMMVTREIDATRLNIRVDTERKVLATSCG